MLPADIFMSEISSSKGISIDLKESNKKSQTIKTLLLIE
ncbi:unnamed protein product, partial [marine sediment metagenome]